MSELIKGFNTKEGVKKIDYLSLANKPTFDLVASYRKAGSYEWTCPEDGEYIALIVGGGGSGYVGAYIYSWELESGEIMSFLGGRHGDYNLCRAAFSTQTKIPLVVGAGGEAITFVGYEGNVTTNSTGGFGMAGGTSSFNGITAVGGEGGCPAKKYTADLSTYISDKICGWFGFNTFLDENGMPVSMLCDGGDATHNGPVNNLEHASLPTLNKYILSPSIFINDNDSSTHNYTATAIVPTDCGAGSGALRAFSAYYQQSWTLNGAPGADGGVFIYKVR